MFSLTEDNINKKSIDEYHDHSLELYEGIQQCSRYQDIDEECHSDSSSKISFLEFLFQEETGSSICSEFFEDQEHTLAEINHEEQPIAIERCFLIPLNQQVLIFHDF